MQIASTRDSGKIRQILEYSGMRVIGAIRSLIRRGLGQCLTVDDGLAPDSAGTVSDEALNAARHIRGERPPALIIHGVTQRSGTNYTGELLRLHPDLFAYPNKIWEFPFLGLTDDIIRTQTHFFELFSKNSKRIASTDFLPLFGASFIAYLYSFVPAGKRMLLKVPDVHYLSYFFSVFPYETPLLLMRDGRDVVTSTIKTWPQTRFADICALWADSANNMLEFQKNFSEETDNYLTIRFEDIVSDPERFVTAACERYVLDRAMYPYERIKDIPVRGSSTVRARDEVSWKSMSKPENFNPVGRWGNWSARQKRIFKRIAGKTLIEAGYATDLNW